MRIERGKEREKKLVVEKNTRKGREQEIEIWMGIRIPDPKKVRRFKLSHPSLNTPTRSPKREKPRIVWLLLCIFFGFKAFPSSSKVVS